MSRRRHITPIDLQDFLLAKEWKFESDQVIMGQKTVVCSAFPGVQLRVPVDPSYSGADELIEMTLRIYSEASGYSLEDVEYQIAHVHEDVVRVRISGGRTRRELPLDFSKTLMTSLHTLLRAGYSDVTHRRGLRCVGNADQTYAQMFDAKLELHHGDGVALSLACPLDMSRADVESRGNDRQPPMVRRVMRRLRYQLAELADVIEQEGTDDFLRDLLAGGTPRVSVAFCEALAGMFDPKLANAVEVSFLWSPDAPADDPFLQAPVLFRPTDFPFIRNVYQALAALGPALDYVGKLAHLQPDNADGSPGTGKAVFSLFRPDGSVVPTHIALTTENYAKALAAKKTGAFVLASGVLVTANDRASLAPMSLTQVDRFEIVPGHVVRNQ